jgi:hypothetical protein
MRTLIVLMFMSICLSFGCATDEPGPLPDEISTESIGQVEQAESTLNCNCPLGTSWRDGSCKPFAVFGPSSNPCIDSCQCQRFYNWYSYCTNTYAYPSSYGTCVAY